MPLPALQPTADSRTNAERTNVLIRDYNREDTFVPIYAEDTGTATAYAIDPVPGIDVYRVGQLFTFKAENTNTGTAPTLNVNSLGAGTITYPGGGALVPGDIAANGFYTVVVTSATPTFALLTIAGGRSKLLQTVSTQTGAVATGTTQIPSDDTIPQQTEGDQYMSLSITPKSATSRLIIEALWIGSTTAANTCTVALFQDAAANAIAASMVTAGGASFLITVPLKHVMTSGTTSTITFKVRAGFNAAGTTTFNGFGGARKLGGIMASSITITEELL